MNYNPIKSVDGKAVKCPSAYQWKLEDVSNKNAGRTEAGLMDKNRIGQVIGIELSWDNITIEEAAHILRQFNPEYVTVEYLDALHGGYTTSVFYVGDRSAPLYNAKIGRWSNVSFNLIKRDGSQCFR